MTIAFGILLSITMYGLAVMINRRWNVSLTTPLLLTTVGIIGFLLLFNIPHESYFYGARFLIYLLPVATVCFAVPMYKQVSELGRYKAAILTSLIVGCIASVATVAGVAWAFGLDEIIRNSLASVAVTTAIAIGITQELGGIVAITVFAVIITGIFGNAIGPMAVRALGIKCGIAQGLAIGNSSHAMGTAKALEMGPRQGAAASFAIVISGVATAILAPIILWIFG